MEKVAAMDIRICRLYFNLYFSRNFFPLLHKVGDDSISPGNLYSIKIYCADLIAPGGPGRIETYSSEGLSERVRARQRNFGVGDLSVQIGEV